MRVLMINSVCGVRSTGRICTDLAAEFEKDGHEVKIAYGRESVPEKYRKYAIRIGNELGVKISVLHTRLTDKHGLANRIATKKFLKWAEDFHPDILWLHNIHGYYINYEMLFEWIKKHPDMEVRWTLHDCWAFTGHCPYFDMVKCNRWRTHCSSCPQLRNYPTSYFFSNCKKNFDQKRNAFTGVNNLTLLTPSRWLANLVKQSFLKEYSVEVVHNTIDTSIFKPTASDFRKRYGLEDKIIVLGVASVWDKRKGLDDFVKLSQLLDDDYVIVLVGLSEKQIKRLPRTFVGISKTNNAKELAEIYTAADVLVNPTYEDNYPTVNLEAQACGTPVITYRTGGSPESVPSENVIEVGSINMILQRMKDMMF